MIVENDLVNEGDVIAVGDIHATWEPYRQFLNWVEGTQAVVVLLGDMIDRSKGDLAVLEATQRRLDNPEEFGLLGFHALKGNHEKLFLEARQEGFRPCTATIEWLRNGGNKKHCFEMGREHGEWLANLPTFMTIGDTLFIHSGVFPGHDPQITIEENKGDELLWIREPFLTLGPQFEKWSPGLKKVVHGHTPTIFEEHNKENGLGFAPVVTKDRVNIDTGACFTGVEPKGFLTAYNVTQNTFKFFHK